MIDEIVLHNPIDMHTHLRQDDLMKQVVDLTHPTWASVLAMPNTNPPITTIEQVRKYFCEIYEASGTNHHFHSLHTLYFQTSFTKDFLEKAKDKITSIKFYPRGLTTNSEHGCDPADEKVYTVLEIMEELGITLSVHPEARGYYHDRERLFRKHVWDWHRRFPALKIVLEHLSDAESLALLELDNIYATVTPQHLLTTGDDWFGPPFNPHLYCMPCVKRPEDRDALVAAVMSPNLGGKMMAGTDSAPHTEDRKVQCGCAGVFSAPIALQLYTQVFDKAGKLDKLQAFVSDNAVEIHQLSPPDKTVTLSRKPFVIPERYGDLIPMWAGQSIDWSIESVAHG